MEPDTYGGQMNSASLPPSLIAPMLSTGPPSISSSATMNYDTRSSSRRHHHHHHQKKRPEHSSSAAATSTDAQDERIEVKILPQDDNWGETTTITCNGPTDDTLTSQNDTNVQFNDQLHSTDRFEHASTTTAHRRRPSMMIAQFLLYLLCLLAFASSVLFLTLPYALVTSASISINDYTLLVPIIGKLVLLAFGTLLLLHRRRNTAYLPCFHLQKLVLSMLLILIVVAYWLYYVFKLLQPRLDAYERILSMTSSYVDLLLVLLVFSVLILEVKWLYPRWIVKVVRSPDGLTRQYSIGRITQGRELVYLDRRCLSCQVRCPYKRRASIYSNNTTRIFLSSILG
jgi:vang-like